MSRSDTKSISRRRCEMAEYITCPDCGGSGHMSYDNNGWVTFCQTCGGTGMLEILEPADDSVTKYKEFCEWVAHEVLSDDFELNAGSFAEIACRKLNKLEIVSEVDNEWVIYETEED